MVFAREACTSSVCVVVVARVWLCWTASCGDRTEISLFVPLITCNEWSISVLAGGHLSNIQYSTLCAISLILYLGFWAAVQHCRTKFRSLLSASSLTPDCSHWRAFSMLSSCCASRSRARTYHDKIGFTYSAIGRTAQKNGPNACR